jgi:hypothetical protein
LNHLNGAGVEPDQLLLLKRYQRRENPFLEGAQRHRVFTIWAECVPAAHFGKSLQQGALGPP